MRPADCLIIAHDFPPFAGGGVMRIHKFVKYLPLFEISPIVITLKDKYYLSKDYSLFDDYNQTAVPEIFRTGAIDLKIIYSKLSGFAKRGKFNNREIYGVNTKSTLSRWLDNISSSIFIPDLKVLWLPFCIKTAINIIRNRNIKVLITTAPPHSVNLAGIYLKSKFPDIKWIADFRDLWTQYNVYNYSFGYVKKIESAMEFKTFSTADSIICATPSLKSRFLDKYPEIRESKFEVITNGYDNSDFTNLAVEKSKPQLMIKKIFKIVYSGSLNDWRNLDNLIAALKILISVKRINIEKIQINLFGHITDRDIKNIEAAGLTGIFNINEFKRHNDSINELLNADMLLLIIGALEGKEVLTGKLFEYLASRKPIFAIIPDSSDAADLINNYSCGYIANTESAADIADKLFFAYRDFFDNIGNFSSKKNRDIEHFSRKYLTGKLAEIIKRQLEYPVAAKNLK